MKNASNDQAPSSLRAHVVTRRLARKQKTWNNVTKLDASWACW